MSRHAIKTLIFGAAMFFVGFWGKGQETTKVAVPDSSRRFAIYDPNKRDTVKCIALIYHDGPVPLQVKAWAQREMGIIPNPENALGMATSVAHLGMKPNGILFYEDRRTAINQNDIWNYKIKNW